MWAIINIKMKINEIIKHQEVINVIGITPYKNKVSIIRSKSK